MKSTPVSRREAEVLHEIRSRDMLIFTPRDIRRFLKTSKVNTYRIISNMKNKGLITRLEKGKYILTETWEELDIYEIVPGIIRPSYLGFWSALHYHSMTDQVPRTVFLATAKRKKPMKLQGQTVKYVTIKPALFFGYERFGKVVVSDREKTIIDSLKHQEYSGGIGNIFPGITNQLDMEKMVEYCIKTGSSAIASRLGYLAERKGLEFKKEELKSMISTYAKLDPGRGDKRLEPEWKLYVNREII